MNPEQKIAYEWAKSQSYQSVASRYAKTLAALIDSLNAQLTDYHHMEQLVDGKMAENQRLRKINEKLQSQLTESQRREKAAVEDLEAILALACAAEVEGICNYCSDDGENCTGTTGWRGPQEAEHTCETCRHNIPRYDVTMKEECGGCASWSDKWEPKEAGKGEAE